MSATITGTSPSELTMIISSPSPAESGDAKPMPLEVRIFFAATAELKKIDDFLNEGYKKFKEKYPVYEPKNLFNCLIGSPSSCVAKIGVISNIFALIGAACASPPLLIGGLVFSSAVIAMNFEEEKQREILRDLLAKLQETNSSLESSNHCLRNEIEKLKQSIDVLKHHNENLSIQNARLEDNVADLQRKIGALSEHIGQLEKCNEMFEKHLTTLTSVLDKILTAKEGLCAPQSTVDQIRKHLEEIKRESEEFSSFFTCTGLMLNQKHTHLRQQITVIDDAQKTIVREVEKLKAIQGIQTTCDHLLVTLRSLAEVQTQLQEMESHLIGLEKKCSSEALRIKTSLSCCNQLSNKLLVSVYSNEGS